jgi:prefoldin subunit 5
LKKQEHDYLKGYSIYVKTKEKELKTLIQKLNAKNSNNTLKDETIYKLNLKVDSLNKERVKMENEKQELNEKIKHWMARAQAFEQDKNFL